MIAPYAWVITQDHLAEANEPVGTNLNATTLVGPRNPRSDDPAYIKANGRAFRMKDDDGEVYYTGFILTAESAIGSELDFAPLEDFGTPNAGCTSIEYRAKNGAWEAL